MPLSKESLRLLIALQAKDAAADALKKEADAVVPQIEAVKADLANERKALDAAKARIVELEKAKKAKELDAASKEEAARKHGFQLNEVKSNEAYKALQAEIDKERAAAGDIETEILLAMEAIDKARAEEKSVAAELKKVEDFAKRDLERLEAELSHARGRHAEALKEREAAAAAAPADALKVYEHVRSRGKLDAVVPAVDGHCGACQINLAPSVHVELAKLKSLVTCESCQRILYKPEQAAASAA